MYKIFKLIKVIEFKQIKMNEFNSSSRYWITLSII